jgi:anti-sigma factor RsiW
MDEPPVTEAEIQIIREALRAAYDPVLAEPVPATLQAAARRGLRRRGLRRLAALLAGAWRSGYGGLAASWRGHKR